MWRLKPPDNAMHVATRLFQLYLMYPRTCRLSHRLYVSASDSVSSSSRQVTRRLGVVFKCQKHKRGTWTRRLGGGNRRWNADFVESVRLTHLPYDQVIPSMDAAISRISLLENMQAVEKHRTRRQGNADTAQHAIATIQTVRTAWYHLVKLRGMLVQQTSHLSSLCGTKIALHRLWHTAAVLVSREIILQDSTPLLAVDTYHARPRLHRAKGFH
jgi:hypothetical protein